MIFYAFQPLFLGSCFVFPFFLGFFYPFFLGFSPRSDSLPRGHQPADRFTIAPPGGFTDSTHRAPERRRVQGGGDGGGFSVRLGAPGVVP